MIDRVAEDHGIELDIRETVNSTAIIKSLLANGLGYTIQSYSFVHEEVERGDLTTRRLNINGLSRNWSLARLAGRSTVGAVSAVADIITDIANGSTTPPH